MTRQAVVIVPSDEDYKGRVESQEKAESKEVPDNAVMEMKGTENPGQNCIPLYLTWVHFSRNYFTFSFSFPYVIRALQR